MTPDMLRQRLRIQSEEERQAHDALATADARTERERDAALRALRWCIAVVVIGGVVLIWLVFFVLHLLSAGGPR